MRMGEVIFWLVNCSKTLEQCSKSTIKTTSVWLTLNIVQVFLTFSPCSSVFIVQLAHVNASYPAGIYRLKVNNRNTKTRCATCSKLSIKMRLSDIFIVKFEHISHLVLVFFLLTLNM